MIIKDVLHFCENTVNKTKEINCESKNRQAKLVSGNPNTDKTKMKNQEKKFYGKGSLTSTKP